jgi:hypothetical protein
MPDNDHIEKKLLVNGQEVKPGRKVKLRDHLTRAEIDALVAEKRAELEKSQ